MRNLDVAPVMTGKSTKKINRIVVAIAAGAIAVFAASCQKDKVSPEGLSLSGSEVALTVPAGGTANLQYPYFNSTTFGTVSRSATNNIYSVANFLQGTINNTGNPPHNANSTYYFDFSENNGTKSDSADMIFSGTANANLSVPSTYTLDFARSSFDSIASGLIASPTWVNLSSRTIGLNRVDTVNYSVNAGWYNYNVVRHEALPVIEHGVNLTVRITTAGVGGVGNIYIVELQDVYSNRTPNSYITPSNYPYLHFRYKKL